MRNFFTLLIIVFCFTSCSVTEKIVFNDDNSGEFLTTYDMSGVMKQMGEMFSDVDNPDAKEDENKEKGKVMDTTVVFAEIMETYKDSVAALPEDKRLAMEAVKDMYMKINMNEDEEVFNFGVGLDFKSLEDLKGIQEKIRKAQSLNSQSGQVDAMKSPGSPMGKYMQNEKSDVVYDLTSNRFTRTTNLNLNDEELKQFEEMKSEFENVDDKDKEFMSYFENSFYKVELTFHKKIKSTSIKGAKISEDGKSLTYQTNWLDFIKAPKSLDVKVEFEE